MQNLYEKSELWFSLIWIIVYVVGTSFADGISENLGLAKSVTLVLHIVLCIIMAVWIKNSGNFAKYGLCMPKAKASKYLYYVPLLIIISCNLWFGVTFNMSAVETCLYIGSMICVGFLEELIFRGFLFKAMCRDNVKTAIIVSSLTFGIGHLVNLINGSGMDLISNLCQVISAIAIGFMFVIIFYRGGSLWPCIFTHMAINSLSAFEGEAGQTGGMQIMTAAALIVIAIAYSAILMKSLPEGEKKI